ncbi:hypothetical protein LCGC14_2831970 [marine sediment metagenome]|uniref:Uncharacterized protein n=1 Tax=marine sediment metagenome TaxID=412755 RepID=A0A0F8Z0J2_9ZZZZ
MVIGRKAARLSLKLRERVTGASDLIDIAGELRIETEKAMLVFDGEQSVWLPKSLVEENGDGTFAMPEWLAKDKGLI